jgi:DUF1680 family protein
LYGFTDGIEEPVTLTINGEPAALVVDNGLALISRTWQPGDVVELTLPMPVRTVTAHALVADTVGKVALQRGPLVYAVEAIDNDRAVLDLFLEAQPDFDATFEPDLLGGITVIRARAARRTWAGPSRHQLVAIPYFAWANREAGEMAVWLPMLGETR